MADDAKAFFGAAMVVLIVAVSLVAAGVVEDGGGSASVSAPVLALPAIGQTFSPQTSDAATEGPPAAPADVPILMYHQVLPSLPESDPTGELAVTADAFADQVAYLDCAGFTSITVGQLLDALEGNAELPAKPVVLSFDDGWIDQYDNAFPVLKEHGFTASFGVIPGFADAGGPYVSREQMKEMSDAGMEITSHSASHVTVLAAEDDALRGEIVDSKAAIEAAIGKTVEVFVYPSGEPFRNGTAEDQAKIVQMLRNAGYRGALLANNTYGGHDAAHPFELNRMRVTGEQGLGTFAGSIYGPSPDEAGCR